MVQNDNKLKTGKWTCQIGTGLQAGFFVYQKADWELKTGTKSALVPQCGFFGQIRRSRGYS